MNLRMSNRLNLNLLLALTLSTVFFMPAAFADDTEVYVGGNAGASVVRPNVLFVIDTSGSMNELVSITTGTYDPAVTYTPATCDSSHIYWSTNGTPPKCDTDNYIETTTNTCNDSASALAVNGTGYYVGRFARYRVSTSRRGANTSTWTNLNNSDHTSKIECESDYSNHGDGVDASKLYPANGGANGGPWRTNSTNAISWSSTGTNYTLYTANYLNWYWAPGTITTKTRIDIVKETFTSLMNSTSGINASLMRFDSGAAQGGYFLQPMQELNSTTRPTLITSVNALAANGYTPLAETLYEASLFYRGQPVDYGDSSSPATNITSVLDTTDTTKYKSPIEYQCQKNFVVYMTDGAPTQDTDADTKITGLPNFNSLTGSSTCSGDCMDELAQWMYKSDINSTLNDKQNVITYTIGLNIDIPLLSDTASKGGGKYYTTTGASDLSTAFTSILTEILAVNTTFIAPAVTVNAFNRLTHRDDLYFAVFRPAGSAKWPGNLKHYKLAGTPTIVVDANNAAAVDVNTGFFAGNSRSIWTLNADAPDGDDVETGGAAGLLTTTRNLYTYLGAAAPSNVNLTATANIFHEDNTALTKALLNISAESDAYRTSLLQWARGVDVLDDDSDGLTDDARRTMGDILHSKPVLMTYGGTDVSPDITVFTGTNEGFIQAFNATTGVEVFSFIPKELLTNLDLLFDNSATVKHPYGMDGAISLWHKDLNANGVLLDSSSVIEAGEHVYLYSGMRRGGNHYYALDISNRSVPKLLWQIDGGAGDFADLGQTWSRPVVSKIRFYNGTVLEDRNVLIFGGGYDTNQDTAGVPLDDNIGHAIYMVDAVTGQRLWWASSDSTANLVLSSMTNSIPADVKVIDINMDGYADRLYVGDMGGRIWRIDFNNTSNTGAANFASGGLLATLGGTDEANNRRFYYSPDVALVQIASGYALTVSIGSGYREHPLNTVTQDRFYMIRDTDVYAPPADTNSDGKPDYPAYTETNLFDATDNALAQASGAALTAAQSLFDNSKGWYIRLTKSDGTYEGEKVLASSITVQGQVIFTTFTPVVNSQATACAPSQGTAKAYVVNLTNATPVYNLQADGLSNSRNDRYVTLVRGGIPPEPTVLFPSDGSKPIVLVGPEKLSSVDLTQPREKTYWRQEE